MPVVDGADLDDAALKVLEPFRRADAYRLCLTPALERAAVGELRGDDPVAA